MSKEGKKLYIVLYLVLLVSCLVTLHFTVFTRWNILIFRLANKHYVFNNVSLTRPRVNGCTTFNFSVGRLRRCNAKLIIMKTDDRNILKSATKHVLYYKNKLLLLSIPIFHWSTSSTTAV